MDQVVPYDYRERSGVIHNRKCILHGAIVTPDGVTESYADIHDGENTSHPKAFRVRCLAKRSTCLCFRTPVLLQKGLHVEFGADLESVTICSEVVKD